MSEGWPPNQQLNTDSNTRFEKTDCKDYYYEYDPDVRVIPGFNDGVPGLSTLIGAQLDGGGDYQPTWGNIFDLVPSQTLYEADDVNFNTVLGADTVEVKGQARAGITVIVNENGPGLTEWYTFPNQPAPRDGLGRGMWAGATVSGVEFTPALKDLRFHTTNPDVCTQVPISDGGWFGAGAAIGFNPGVWYPFSLNGPAVPTYPVVANVVNGSADEQWESLGGAFFPAFRLFGASGLFVVDWTLSFNPSGTYDNVAVYFEFCVAPSDNGGFVPRIDAVGPSYSTTTANQVSTYGLGASDQRYSTLTGGGLVYVNNNDYLAFYGRLASGGPANGHLYVKNLSVTVKRFVPY